MNIFIVDQTVPEIEFLPLLLEDGQIVYYPFKIKRKGRLLSLNLFRFRGAHNSFLGKLTLRLNLHVLAVIVKVFCLLDLDKEFLGMRANLSTGPGLDEVLYFFPVLSVNFEAIEELLVLFLSPSSIGSALNAVKHCHQISFLEKNLKLLYRNV